MPKTKKIDYEELHNEDLESVVAADNEPENPIEKEAEKIEEVVPDDKLDKALEEQKKEPVVDVDKIKEDLKSEVTKEVTDAQISKMKEVFGLEEKADEPKTPWDKEGRTPSWTEALDYVAQQAEEKLKSNLAKQEEEAKAAEESAKKSEEQTVSQWNAYWDSQISDLEKAGKIPKMTKADESDPGQKARVSLFKAMLDVNNKRIAQGLPQITNLKEIYYEHYTDPNAQPAGENAPIAGDRRSVSQSTNDDVIDYHTLHNSSIEDFLR